MLETGGSTRGARVWKPWVPTANAGSSSQAAPRLDFELTQPIDQAQMSADASSPRLPNDDHGMSADAASHVMPDVAHGMSADAASHVLPDAAHGMSAYAVSHRLAVAEDVVSLAPADSPTSSRVDPATRSPVMVSGVSTVRDSEAIYELPGLMASGSDSQPTQTAQPATVTVRHAPVGPPAVSDAAAAAAVEPLAAQAPAGLGAVSSANTAVGPPDAEAPAGQGAVPTAAGLGHRSMAVSTYQAVGSGAGQGPAGASLDLAAVDGDAAAGQAAASAGARLDPVPVAGHSAAGLIAAPAAGSLQLAPAASAAAGQGKSVSGAPSTSQASMDARQMQLPARFAPGEAAGGLLHAHAECTLVSALCRGLEISIFSP